MFLVKHQRRPDDVGMLAALFRELDIPTQALSPLLGHAEAVHREGDRLGLVSRQDLPHVVARHSADSLLFALAHRPRAGARWADVGSGAGFPGFVLAICFPEAHFTLIEPQQRRAGFLQLAASDLGLANVVVLTARAEAVAPGFDVCVARALADPSAALTACIRLAPTAIVAAGRDATLPEGASETRYQRRGVDSSGRLFMMTRPTEGE
jgi:16S rRNA (guanine(527)-N(7))-methyltransferase RsmG